MLMENVKALTQKKFLPYLQKWVAYLDGLGYKSYMKVLNAKDYGVPQNRERTFVVSVMKGSYDFPKPFKLEKRIKDIKEDNVEQRYYISKCVIDTFIRRTVEAKKKGNGFAFILRDGNDIAAVVKCRAGSQIEDNFIKEYVCHEVLGSKTDGIIYPFQIPLDIRGRGDLGSYGYRIRKLTPRECFRLMGVSEDNIDKIQQAGISNSQQYKMAGNSIVVDVLYHIFRKMFVDKSRETAQLTLF